MENVTLKTEFDNRPIGVLDSGIGGLTVLKHLVEKMPSEKFIYYGDTKNLPYGEKSTAHLVEIVKNIFDFFIDKNVKAVIHGCNTTSAQVYDKIKDNYDFPIYPILQIACEGIAKENYKKLAVFATTATVNSGMYTKSLKRFNPDIDVLEIACPQWVDIVESGEWRVESFLREELGATLHFPLSTLHFPLIKSAFDKLKGFDAEKIILGCTHYPCLMDILTQFAERDKFINPAEYFANFIQNDLRARKLHSRKKTSPNEFYVSSDPESFLQKGKAIYPNLQICNCRYLKT